MRIKPRILYTIDTPEGREIYRPKTLRKAIARLKATPNTTLMRCVSSRLDPILENDGGKIYRFIYTLDGDLSVRTLRRAGIPWGKPKLSRQTLRRAWRRTWAYRRG